MNGDYEWYLNVDLDKYVGKWIVVLNKKIIASGDNIKSLLEKIKKEYPNSTPFVAKVPRKILMVA